MWFFNGLNSLMLVALFPPRMIFLIFWRVKMKHQKLLMIRKARIIFQLKTSEIRSNPRSSLLCIQKWEYVITWSHCAFFMTDLKLKSSSLSIVRTYWRSVIIARRLVYPKEFISPGLLSAFATIGSILKMTSCNGKNIVFFLFMTLCVVKKGQRGENNLLKPINHWTINDSSLSFLSAIFSVEAGSEVIWCCCSCTSFSFRTRST